MNALETDPNFAEQIRIAPKNIQPANAAPMIRQQIAAAPWVQPQQQMHPTAHIEILEQTTSKPLRFRYVGEDRITMIPGINSTSNRKTFPGIKVGFNHFFLSRNFTQFLIISNFTNGFTQALYRIYRIKSYIKIINFLKILA